MRRRRLHTPWNGTKRRGALLIAAGTLAVLFAPVTGHAVAASLVVVAGFGVIGIGVFWFQGGWQRPVPPTVAPEDDDPDALAG